MSSWAITLIAELNRDARFDDDELDALGDWFRENVTFGREPGPRNWGFEVDVTVDWRALVVPEDQLGGEAGFVLEYALRRVSRALERANRTRIVKLVKLTVAEES